MRTRFHRGGHVTVWDVFRQEWIHTSRPRDEVLASLPPRERERAIRHCGIGRATAADPAAKLERELGEIWSDFAARRCTRREAEIAHDRATAAAGLPVGSDGEPSCDPRAD